MFRLLQTPRLSSRRARGPFLKWEAASFHGRRAASAANPPRTDGRGDRAAPRRTWPRTQLLRGGKTAERGSQVVHVWSWSGRRARGSATGGRGPGQAGVRRPRWGPAPPPASLSPSSLAFVPSHRRVAPEKGRAWTRRARSLPARRAAPPPRARGTRRPRPGPGSAPGPARPRPRRGRPLAGRARGGSRGGGGPGVAMVTGSGRHSRAGPSASAGRGSGGSVWG